MWLRELAPLTLTHTHTPAHSLGIDVEVVVLEQDLEVCGETGRTGFVPLLFRVFRFGSTKRNQSEQRTDP